MTTFTIENTKSAVTLGTYEADTPEAAWLACCEDAGYTEAQPMDDGTSIYETPYTITATTTDRNGRTVDATDHEGLGEYHGRAFASREDAQAAIDHLLELTDGVVYTIEGPAYIAKRITLTCQEPDVPAFDQGGNLAYVQDGPTYEVDGALLPDGRLITYGSGVDGGDSLWASVDAFEPNGLDSFVKVSVSDGTREISLDDLRSADRDNRSWGDSLLTSQELGPDTEPALRCVNDTYEQDSGETFEGVADFLAMCRACFGEAPELVSPGADGVYYLKPEGWPHEPATVRVLEPV